MNRHPHHAYTVRIEDEPPRSFAIKGVHRFAYCRSVASNEDGTAMGAEYISVIALPIRDRERSKSFYATYSDPVEVRVLHQRTRSTAGSFSKLRHWCIQTAKLDGYVYHEHEIKLAVWRMTMEAKQYSLSYTCLLRI
jgi:hypothetical protein